MFVQDLAARKPRIQVILKPRYLSIDELRGPLPLAYDPKSTQFRGRGSNPKYVGHRAWIVDVTSQAPVRLSEGIGLSNKTCLICYIQNVKLWLSKSASFQLTFSIKDCRRHGS
jgi:hypothetical protein